MPWARQRSSEDSTPNCSALKKCRVRLGEIQESSILPSVRGAGVGPLGCDGARRSRRPRAGPPLPDLENRLQEQRVLLSFSHFPELNLTRLGATDS